MDQAVVFDRLELRELANKRKSRAVAEAILDAIRSGRLHAEERLPSERTLAEQLGVSRGAVREALSALQLSGAIQVRTGEGSFVDPACVEQSADQTLSILDHNRSPLELWEARRELEFTLARMASDAAEDAHVRAIGQHLDAMRAAAENHDLGRYIAANNAFHEAIIEPVSNSILLEFAIELIRATNQLLTRESVQAYLRANLTASIRKHVDIFAAFERADVAGLKTAIDHHYDELITYYLDS